MVRFPSCFGVMAPILVRFVSGRLNARPLEGGHERYLPVAKWQADSEAPLVPSDIHAILHGYEGMSRGSDRPKLEHVMGDLMLSGAPT